MFQKLAGPLLGRPCCPGFPCGGGDEEGRCVIMVIIIKLLSPCCEVNRLRPCNVLVAITSYLSIVTLHLHLSGMYANVTSYKLMCLERQAGERLGQGSNDGLSRPSCSFYKQHATKYTSVLC